MRFVSSTIKNIIRNSEPEKCLVNMADFDGVSYRVSSTSESKNKLTVSVAMRCYPELKKYGAEAVLNREYPNCLLPTPEEGFDVSLCISLDNLPEDRRKLL